METKEIKIEVPKGYEIDKENSTFEKIVFKKIEKPEPKTYREVADSLFSGKNGFYTDRDGDIVYLTQITNSACCPNTALTKEQLEWLMALNKLKNVAVYLNESWVPNWQNKCWDKHYLFYDYEDNTVNVSDGRIAQYSVVYFKSVRLAQEAINILGEEVIKTALGVYLKN